MEYTTMLEHVASAKARHRQCFDETMMPATKHTIRSAD